MRGGNGDFLITVIWLGDGCLLGLTGNFENGPLVSVFTRPQSRAVHGKAHDRAVLEGSFNLVALASSQVGELKQSDQLLPIDQSTPWLSC